MMYALLIHGDEAAFAALPAPVVTDMLARHAAVRAQFTATHRLGAVLRLQPNDLTVLVHRDDGPVITDGPYTESKEMLMGLFLLDCDTREEAIATASTMLFPGARIEVREIPWYDPGQVRASRNTDET
jgi:hypothetical protein